MRASNVIPLTRSKTEFVSEDADLAKIFERQYTHDNYVDKENSPLYPSGANAHKSFAGTNPMKSQNSEIVLVTAVDVAGRDELKTQPPGEYTAAFGAKPKIPRTPDIRPSGQ